MVFCLSRSFASVAAHEKPTALARITPMPATALCAAAWQGRMARDALASEGWAASY